MTDDLWHYEFHFEKTAASYKRTTSHSHADLYISAQGKSLVGSVEHKMPRADQRHDYEGFFFCISGGRKNQDLYPPIATSVA